MKRLLIACLASLGLLVPVAIPAQAITAQATTCNSTLVGRATVKVCHVWLWYGGTTNYWLTGGWTGVDHSLCVESLSGYDIRFIADRMPDATIKTPVYSIYRATGTKRCVADLDAHYKSGYHYERIRIEWYDYQTGNVCRGYIWFDRYTTTHKNDYLPC